MKKRILPFLLLLLLVPLAVCSQQFVNLTPVPRSMQTHDGELLLPSQFAVSTAGLSQDMTAEVEKFISSFNAATGYSASATTQPEAFVTVSETTEMQEEEGYQLNITTEGIHIEAATPTGLFYAFQSIRKMLPPNVMAGVRDPAVTRYALPLAEIEDAPRFAYRGFMLDVSRHFFSTDEIKRVLDIMACYKMNRFHWHLTDDHGWRVEIKKYPKLTTIGSISDNRYMVDMKYGTYWLNKPYGPFFYTQEELKDVVAYARERHIEIIPEIDMPGHFCAAMAAYPEYSCTPEGNHNVSSAIGGIFADVMNVANPQAVQFAKDILTEIMDIFPGEYIHIGGDECPTSAWENNAQCIARKQELGLSSFRELQSVFIQEMAEHVKANHRKLSVWNEAITASGANVQTIANTGATVYCWVGADAAVAKAASLGLDHIYTPQIPFYINRKQSTDPGEPVGAGNGTDNLEAVYKQRLPVPAGSNAQLFTGIQGTFWTEYVGFNDYLEYLMLPRIVAIAESGWTPENRKNFDSFCQRITADSTLYNYNNYSYGRHYMNRTGETEKVMPNVSTAEKKYWYRLTTRATDDRRNKCIELLGTGSPLIAQYSSKGAAEGRLWTNTPATEGSDNYDYQLWALEEDAAQPGLYALVCKAFPDGSASPSPTGTSTGGRWNYDKNRKNYSFLLADNGYGKDGESYYYSLRSNQTTGLWMNASLSGQGFAVNIYNNPGDGNSGLWKFQLIEGDTTDAGITALLQEAEKYLRQVRTYASPEEKCPGYFGEAETQALRDVVEEVRKAQADGNSPADLAQRLQQTYAKFRHSFGYLENGKTYRLANAVDGFDGIVIADSGKGNQLRHSRNIDAYDAWTVSESNINEDFSQTVKLQNAQTLRFIGATASNAVGHAGYPVSVGNTAATVRLTFQPEEQDFVISINGKNLFPIDESSYSLPGVISAGSSDNNSIAIRPMGAAWNIEAVRSVTFQCYDQDDRFLGEFHRSFRSAPAWEDSVPPIIRNHNFVEQKEDKYIYQRTAYTIVLECRDSSGAIISAEETTHPLNESYTVQLPQPDYYTFSTADYPDGTVLHPETDQTVHATYTTTAYNGVKRLGKAVTEVQAGRSYVIYDASPNDVNRKGYRNVNSSLQVMKTNIIEDSDPNHTWLLETFGTRLRVKNVYHNAYVPQLTTAANPVKLTSNGAGYSFILNEDGESWKIKGTNNVCWDGLESGALVGWTDPGHPYYLYEYFAQPYFEVAIESVTTTGENLNSERHLVKAGDAYILTAGTYEGFALKAIEGDEGLSSVGEHKKIKLVYEKDTQSGIGETLEELQEKSIYDLSGRRILRISQKGIYIINGKKVLVK